MAGTTGRARFAGAPGAGLLVLREALASASRLCSARRRGGHRAAASKRWRHPSARCFSRVARNEMGGAMVSQSSFRDICNDLKCINEQYLSICPSTGHFFRVRSAICIENLIGRPSRAFGRAHRGPRASLGSTLVSAWRGIVVHAACCDCASVLWAFFMRRCPSSYERKGLLT